MAASCPESAYLESECIGRSSALADSLSLSMGAHSLERMMEVMAQKRSLEETLQTMQSNCPASQRYIGQDAAAEHVVLYGKQRLFPRLRQADQNAAAVQVAAQVLPQGAEHEHPQAGIQADKVAARCPNSLSATLKLFGSDPHAEVQAAEARQSSTAKKLHMATSSSSNESVVAPTRTLRQIDDNVETLIVRNIPWTYSQEELTKEWPSEGSYNFLHLPFSSFLGRTVGFAIINFTGRGVAKDFHKSWNGRTLARHSFKKPLSICRAMLQGLLPNLKLVKLGMPVLPYIYRGRECLSVENTLAVIRAAHEQEAQRQISGFCLSAGG